MTHSLANIATVHTGLWAASNLFWHCEFRSVGHDRLANRGSRSSPKIHAPNAGPHSSRLPSQWRRHCHGNRAGRPGRLPWQCPVDGGFNRWTINGAAYPDTLEMAEPMLRLTQSRRYGSACGMPATTSTRSTFTDIPSS
jgi:hypothetical protein